MRNKKGENTSHYVLTIQNLDDDCLLHIFSFLSIIDRVKVQRVCQRWKILSHTSWRSVKRLSVRQHFWGVSDKNNIQIDRYILKRILELCGRFVTHADLSNENEYYGSHKKIRIQSCKAIFCIIQEMCPNIRSINVGRPCTESTVEYVANHFNKLTHFAIQGVNDKYEDYLSILFSNNQNLRYLSMKDCCLTNKCLLNLKSESVEELCLDDCSVGMLQHLLSSLEQFKKLCSLKFVRCRSDQASWITSTLSSISSNLTNLKKLDIYLYDCNFECIECSCIDQLKNLEILYIGGNVMATDEIINIISNNCRKLTNVRIYNSDNITDVGLSSIASLPNLQYLSVRSLEMITDNFFKIMFKLITLECRRCPNIKNDGISKLILASNHLKMIKINCCANISALGFSDSVIASRNDKLTVEIDSSEIDDNFISNYCSITKYGDSIVRKIKQLCYNCLKSSNAHASCIHCCDITEAL
ncbi:F-box/LRR-repeat protein 7-like [Nasonia vitripennis]|uniref:F-box domain-containing protein n=1 Tax=Nasonia vitripennis TaxID=7425 RepID=A0A7M7H8V7_NASVI|nr:F-box/LRR-repeat protein 7-like [Nasonia vitripennis]XP_008212346.1 F-box/LRR-repeat protein 7-like [Nasonia vitripennis]XP_031789617.1 F-box/LRR-repeat protein 7-like [Nasonia vitripennis]